MKKSFLLLYLYSIFLLLGFTGCNRKGSSLENFNQEVYTPEYASGFKIVGAEDQESTIISVYNPWQSAKDIEMHYFIARNNEPAPESFTGQVIA
ncbi:MAG: iron ABC transporter substrate-binding protein, partial [Prevotellaceae bacterium]|nr:iron ABC transporter substrate-binding protein [Prevotellaceae bacterium]